MTPFARRAILIGVLALAAVAVFANVLIRSSELPPLDASAVAAATPVTAATPEPTPTAEQLAAFQDLQRRLTENPRDPAALTQYADMLMQAGAYPQAADTYAIIASIEPQNANAHMKLGAALFYQGIPGMAQVELKRAVDIDPNNVEAQFNYGLAMSHGPGADSQAATAAWRTVAKLDPTGELGQQAMRMLAQTAQATPP